MKYFKNDDLEFSFFDFISSTTLEFDSFWFNLESVSVSSDFSKFPKISFSIFFRNCSSSQIFRLNFFYWYFTVTYRQMEKFRLKSSRKDNFSRTPSEPMFLLKYWVWSGFKWREFRLKFSRTKQNVVTYAKKCLLDRIANGTLSFEDMLRPILIQDSWT